MKRYPLSDKVVLITGAGRGLGAATATALTRRGARVVIADIDRCMAEKFAATLPTGKALALECDVTRIDCLHEVVRRMHEEFGRIDVAIANAGVLGRGGTMRALTPDQVGAVMAVNVTGVVNTVSATLESVIGVRGQIVVVSSVFAYINGAGAIPYAMSKAAVEQLGGV
jgi:NAD(P)-dependent dehydrogenase (short-subunit alcohol dehydrogenase family)